VSDDANSLRDKALGEFVEGSLEAKMETSRTVRRRLLCVLDGWARENGYVRHEVVFGTAIRTLWFSASPEQSNPPIDSVELLLGHVLPDGFSPLAELIGNLSGDPDLGFRGILASLILHELDSNNVDGAEMAADALDKNIGRIRALAERLTIRNENLREFSETATDANIKRGEITVAEVCRYYDELIDAGELRRGIAKIIAPKVQSTSDSRPHISPSHVNRILHKYRPAKK
jgi:hypothetical protein